MTTSVPDEISIPNANLQHTEYSTFQTTDADVSQKFKNK